MSILLLVMVMIPAIIISKKVSPEIEINNARKTLAEAESGRSSVFASSQFRKASSYYDSAYTSWQKENEKMILLRDYTEARQYAIKSVEFSKTAIETANSRKLDSAGLLKRKIKLVEEKINEFDVKYGTFPFNSVDQNNLSNCKLLLKEGQLAIEKDDYVSCKVKLDLAEKIIVSLHNNYNERQAVYFQDFSQWEKWVEQGISSSAQNGTSCIVIDKTARQGTFYSKGNQVMSFNIELGPNWIGDKIKQGDKSTPEGIYRIIGKKSKGSTHYHKALLLDYPNEEDKKRFQLNKKNGVLDKDDEIGSLIEIHGEGGKGADWTNGCIALKNSEMDRLFNLCPQGAKVIIVGSVRPLDQIYSKSE